MNLSPWMQIVGFGLLTGFVASVGMYCQWQSGRDNIREATRLVGKFQTDIESLRTKLIRLKLSCPEKKEEIKKLEDQLKELKKRADTSADGWAQQFHQERPLLKEVGKQREVANAELVQQLSQEYRIYYETFLEILRKRAEEYNRVQGSKVIRLEGRYEIPETIFSYGENFVTTSQDNMTNLGILIFKDTGRTFAIWLQGGAFNESGIYCPRVQIIVKVAPLDPNEVSRNYLYWYIEKRNGNEELVCSSSYASIQKECGKNGHSDLKNFSSVIDRVIKFIVERELILPSIGEQA